VELKGQENKQPMKIKSIIAGMLLIVASMQTANAQKVVLKKTDGSSVVCNVSELNSIDFIEAGSWLVTKIVLSETSVTLEPDEIKTLSATVFPEDADNKAVSWESSNEDVAEVNKNGRVIANANGTCTITCRATDGSDVKAECHVTVTDVTFVTNITLNHTSLSFTLPDNASQTLTASVQPNDATNKSVSWSSSETSVATVSKAGKVTAVGEGKCTITCSAVDGSGIKAECQVTVSKATQGTTNGHEWVDLGLPSGTLWATCNVGASSPSEYGNYYAWGETSTKTNYTWNTYRYCMGTDETLTKYCSNSSYGYNGYTDGIRELEPSDDAATVNWGNAWQMPSADQIVELYNGSYTTTSWTTQGGVYGRKITSKSNGKSIFLPAAGWYYYSHIEVAGSVGFYSSRTRETNLRIYYLYFNSSSITLTSFCDRSDGLSVRPVRKK